MEPNNQPGQQNNKSRASKRKKFIIIAVGVLLLLLIGILGYFYWIGKENTDQNRSQTPQTNTGQNNTNSPPESTPAQATYTAKVGRFTLTLGELYYIIIDLDGPFEGGPATRLAIGTRSDEGQQTVFSATHSRVTIEAYPINEFDSYESRVQTALQDVPDSQKLADTQVDGVKAEVYQLDGLFTDKKLLFTKNNIFYDITAHGSDTSGGVLEAVIKGFKFVS